MTSPKGALWEQDEEFRQKVIRQAMLLGFSAEEWDAPHAPGGIEKVWVFRFEGVPRRWYPSLYSAALEYLRLMKVPQSIIGVDIGQV